MILLNITRKTLRELWREPKMSALLLLFPALLIVIYYVAFGNSGGGLATYLRLLVLNQDEGAVGGQLVDTLRSTQYDDNPVFTVDLAADRSGAEISLRERKAALLLVIPPDFSRSLQPGSETPLTIVGDPNYDYYVFASGFLTPITDAFIQRQMGIEIPAEAAQMEFVTGTGQVTSDLQFGIPGVMVFGVTFGIILVAVILVRERTTGTLSRLFLTRATAVDLIGGIALAEAALALLQIVIAFGVALLCGFQSSGSLVVAVLIGVVVSFAVSGLGLVAGCLSRNENQANAISTLLLLPLVFLSGAIFPMPPMPVGTLAGRVLNLYDIFPTRHATEAIRRILIYGDSLQAVAFELIALLVLVLIYLAAGVLVYRWRRVYRLA